MQSFIGVNINSQIARCPAGSASSKKYPEHMDERGKMLLMLLSGRVSRILLEQLTLALKVSSHYKIFDIVQLLHQSGLFFVTPFD